MYISNKKTKQNNNDKNTQWSATWTETHGSWSQQEFNVKDHPLRTDNSEKIWEVCPKYQVAVTKQEEPGQFMRTQQLAFLTLCFSGKQHWPDFLRLCTVVLVSMQVWINEIWARECERKKTTCLKILKYASPSLFTVSHTEFYFANSAICILLSKRQCVNALQILAKKKNVQHTQPFSGLCAYFSILWNTDMQRVDLFQGKIYKQWVCVCLHSK